MLIRIDIQNIELFWVVKNNLIGLKTLFRAKIDFHLNRVYDVGYYV